MTQTRQPIPYSLTGLNPYPWLRWWYALAAPPTPPDAENLPLKKREFLRRGKLNSFTMLFQFLLLLLAFLPAAQRATETGPLVVLNIAGAVLLLVVSVLLNRSGKLLFAGILLILGLEMTQTATIFFDGTTGLEAHTVTTVYLLVTPLLIAVLTLPTWGVVITAAFNIIVIVVALTVYPESAAFHTLMRISPVPALYLVVPIVTQLFCAALSSILVSSLRESLTRADRAEEINKLQQILAEQAKRELQTKNQLEEGLSEITAVLARLGNGDTQARVHLEQGHPLWAIAGNINNMVGRFMHLRQQDQYVQQMATGVRSTILAIHTAKITKQPLVLPRTGNRVDQQAAELLAAELLTYGEGQATKNRGNTPLNNVSIAEPRSASSPLSPNLSINKPANSTLSPFD